MQLFIDGNLLIYTLLFSIHQRNIIIARQVPCAVSGYAWNSGYVNVIVN